MSNAETACYLTGEDIVRIGRKRGLERIANFVNMTLEAVLDCAVKGIEQTNHGPVGRDQNVPSVRTELKAGPVAVDFRLESNDGGKSSFF